MKYHRIPGNYVSAVVNLTIWLDGGESIKIITTKGEIDYEFSETQISATGWIDYRVKGLVREIYLQGESPLLLDQDAQQDTGGENRNEEAARADRAVGAGAPEVGID